MFGAKYEKDCQRYAKVNALDFNWEELCDNTDVYVYPPVQN